MQKLSTAYFKFIISIIFLFCIFNTSPSLAQPQSENVTTYRFGVITLSHPIVLYRQYIPFFDYINEHLPWSFELVLYKEYKDVVQAIENGHIDMALLGGNTFIQAKRHTNLYPIAAVRASDNTTKTYSIFIVKSDNKNINSLQDLHNKSIAFGPNQSTSSYLIPLNFLKKNSINLDDFSKYDNLNNHDAVARAVLRGEYDAGVMGEAFAQRFINQGLKQIATTNSFPGFILVAREGVPKDVCSALRKFLLDIKPQSAELLQKTNAWPEILRHGFAPVVMDDYFIFYNLSTISE